MLQRSAGRRIRHLEEVFNPRRRVVYVTCYAGQSEAKAIRDAGTRDGDVVFLVVYARRGDGVRCIVFRSTRCGQNTIQSNPDNVPDTATVIDVHLARYDAG